MTENRPTVVFLSGPNRGLGHALLKALLLRPNHTVIAGVRNPEAELSQKLKDLLKANGSELIIVKCDAGVETDAAKAVAVLKEKHNITYIDRVIANAGMSDTVEKLVDTTPDAIRRHMDVHLFGPLTLFQATVPLLEKSHDPKFFTMSSGLASIRWGDLFQQGPWYCYGVTKVTQSFTIRRMHFEHPNITSVLINPGWMKTDMGAWAAKVLNLGPYEPEGYRVEVKDAAEGCLKIFDEASRTKYSGEFVSYSVPNGLDYQG